MADVVISDPATGTYDVCDVRVEASQVRVVANNLRIDIIDGPTTVTVRGTDPTGGDIFLRMRLRFNGSTNDPTLLSKFPLDDWSPPAENYFYCIYANNNPTEFEVRWAHGGFTPGTLYLGNIVGTSFNQIVTSSFSTGSTYDIWRFKLRLNGVDVYPANLDECTITLVR